jgi:hypothetical protein
MYRAGNRLRPKRKEGRAVLIFSEGAVPESGEAHEIAIIVFLEPIIILAAYISIRNIFFIGLLGVTSTMMYPWSGNLVSHNHVKACHDK